MAGLGYNYDYYTYMMIKEMIAQNVSQEAVNLAIEADNIETLIEIYNASRNATQVTDIVLADGTQIGAAITKEVTLPATGPVSTATTTGKVASAVDIGTYTSEGVEKVAMKGVGQTGASEMGSFVFGKVLPCVAAASAGFQMGVWIDGEIYKHHPDWWWYNVQTWDNVLLGTDTSIPLLHDTETGTTYMTEEAFNNFMLALGNLGAFTAIGEWDIPQNPTSFEEGGVTYDTLTSYAYLGPGATIYQTVENSGIYSFVIKYEFDCGIMLYTSNNTQKTIWFRAVGTTPGAKAWTKTSEWYTGGLPQHGGTKVNTEVQDKYLGSSPERTINGKSVYTNWSTFDNEPDAEVPKITTSPIPALTNPTNNQILNTIWYTQYGDVMEAVEKTESVPGINIKPDEVVPVEPAAGVAVNYPNLWANRKTTHGYKKNPVTGQREAHDTNWVPVPMPEMTEDMAKAVENAWEKIRSGEATVFDGDEMPEITGDMPQVDDGSYPAWVPGTVPAPFEWTIPNSIIEGIRSIIDPSINPIPSPSPTPSPSPEPGPEPGPEPEPTPQPDPMPMPEPSPVPDPLNPDNPQPPNPEPEGNGETPIVHVPEGLPDNGLVMPYNPTRAQLVEFSRWLWSTNFIDAIKKLFQSPSDAIINLMEIYVTPHTGGTNTITCGYIDSGVSSKWIDERYKVIDCGEVNIVEKYGNIFDYEYTDVSLFLPFIGFVDLDVDAVMRSSVQVIYTVDVLSGACLARVLLKRDTFTVQSYSFGGNCGVIMPWSNGSFGQVYSSIAMGAVTLALAKTPGAAIMGAASHALSAKPQVSKSGNYGASTGSMDCKKPFIVLKRNMTAMPNAYQIHQGYPFHQTTNLIRCKGYTIATNIHYSGPAIAEEVNEIEELLSNGVIL